MFAFDRLCLLRRLRGISRYEFYQECFRGGGAADPEPGQEGQTKEIDLSANDPEAVESMIEYLYSDDYHNPEINALAAAAVEQTLGEGASATAKSITSTSDPFLFNVKVYILADR